MLRAGGVGKLLAALVPFWVQLSLHSCRVWGRYKVWILPFAESGLLPYQCPKVHDNYSFVSNHLLIKLTCLELINEWDLSEQSTSTDGQVLVENGILTANGKPEESEAFHSSSLQRLIIRSSCVLTHN